MLWCVGQVGYPIAREWTGSISKLLVTVEAVASTPSSFWYPSGPWRTMCSFSYSLRWGVYTKKKSIMIVQYHSLMGKGTRKRKSTEEEPGINMIGNSYTTRVLWSVMLGRAYGVKRKNRPLLKLISYLSNELTKAFYEGIPLQHHKLGTIYLIPLCMKGDWPALTQTWRPNPPLWVLGDFRGEWKRNLPYVQCRSPRIPKLAWSLIWKHGKDAWGSTPAMEGRAFIGVCHTVAWFGQTLLLQSRCFSCPSQGFHGRHCSKCTGFSNGLAWFSRILLFIMLSVWT